MEYTFTANVTTVEAESAEEARLKMRQVAPEGWEIERVNDRNAELVEE
jgi:hypothetical protein